MKKVKCSLCNMPAKVKLEYPGNYKLCSEHYNQLIKRDLKYKVEFKRASE